MVTGIFGNERLSPAARIIPHMKFSPWLRGEAGPSERVAATNSLRMTSLASGHACGAGGVREPDIRLGL